KGKPIWDIGSVATSKNDPNRIALGSYSTVPLSIIENGETVSKIFDNNNSPLTPMTKDYYTMIADLKYDDSDNLWMINSYAEEPLKVLTPNNSWKSFNTGTSSKNTYVRKLYIDPTKTKWLSIMGKGLVAFNENEFDNPSDDTYRTITTDPNFGNLPSQDVFALATDLDGKMWIGTDKGLCVLFNPNSILGSPNQSFSAQRIIVNVGGTGEYLLGNTSITDIEIDGGNRKWIATANAGLYLISKDGTEILQSFTTENSPIISNNILDLYLNQQTGELYIITDLGLVSYRVDATKEDPSYSNVSVYPNPHKPSHNVPVTIQGIQANSDVKITDAAGNLIYRTSSNGGTATWDTQTLSGTRAMPGVYFIWTAPENSEIEGNYVGKVVLH
ncbi:MAG: T9SS C-terminal target domain-containing protein, partial [Crocinitomicaceae bacterium]|nr:T9SS C-terminal target domain-containing protein [Crocinitomicaceae bacterium]